MQRHTYNRTLVPRKFAQPRYDTQVHNKSRTNQISDATWRQKEVLWCHDVLNLNFDLEIVIRKSCEVGVKLEANAYGCKGAIQNIMSHTLGNGCIFTYFPVCR